MKVDFIETAKACLANGDRLLFDAEMLDLIPTSLALAILAEEEFAKGFLLVLVGKGVLPWNSAIWRAARDHSCKHLLSILMDYSDPDIEEAMRSHDRFMVRHETMMRLFKEMDTLPSVDDLSPVELRARIERSNELRREVARLREEDERERKFPPYIADAINILRHVKVGRWECGYAYDDEEYDSTAQAIADGARDREKQNALYVGVSKTGAVSSRPDEIDSEAVAQAVERSKKLRWNLHWLIEHGNGHAEFDRLVKNLKVMFASQEELRELFQDEKPGHS